MQLRIETVVPSDGRYNLNFFVALPTTGRYRNSAIDQGLKSRGDWHSFEPAAAMVEAYTSVFLQPFDPHLQAAARLAQASA